MNILFSLKLRIALTIFLLEAAMMVAVLSHTTTLVREKGAEQFAYSEKVLLDLLQQFARTSLMVGEYSELQASIEKAVQDEHIEQVVVTGQDNRVLVSSTPERIGQVFVKDSHDALHHWTSREIGGSESIHILFSSLRLEQSLADAMRQGWSVAIIGMLIIAFSGIAMGWLLTLRLQRLQVAANEIANGNYSALVDMPGSDEIAKLGKAFNTMAFKVKRDIIAYEIQEKRLREAQADLERHSQELEEMVHERTLKLEQVNKALQQQATMDCLTQVSNRHGISDCLKRVNDGVDNEKACSSLILCDIDYFKRYNDTYGHQAGDKCLQQVANLLMRFAKRGLDLVVRYGGEEFMVLLPHTPQEQARSVAESIQNELRELAIEHKSSDVSEFVTLSIGIASVMHLDASSFDRLLGLADKALYQAKAMGRNSIAEDADRALSECQDYVSLAH